jgi:predicted P-loop ATPase
MPILIGTQNCGKSNFFQYLTPPAAMDPGVYPWSSTIQQGIRTIKEKPHLLHAGWIVVLDETERYFQRNYVEEFKNLVSVAVDRSARKYENERNFQRAFVLAGAANSDDFFVDPSGNRRFMPIVVAGKVPSPEDPSTMIIDLDRLKQDRDAIWAAAYKAYLDNPVHTFSADEIKQMAEYQENFRSDNPFDGRVRAVLGIQHSGVHHGQNYVTMSDLYKWLEIPVDRHNSVRIPISDALKNLGYVLKRVRIGGEPRRIWVKYDENTHWSLKAV